MVELGISRGPAVEVRQQGAEGLDLIAGLLSGSGGGTVRDAALGGLQIAAGRVARALAVATVEGDGGLLTPDLLSGIGYDLIRQGESLHLFAVDLSGRPSLLRASTTVPVVSGSADPRTWRYSLSVPGPSIDRTVSACADEVCHVRINASPWQPWRGRSPLRVAESTGRLASALVKSLGEESAVYVARMIAMPTATAQATINGLKALIADPKYARLLLPETTASGFGQGRSSAPLTDWKPSRLGPDWSMGGTELHGLVLQEVLAVCGIPPALAPGANAAGPTLREANREFLTTTIQPLGALIAAEASRVLERPVTIHHHALAAADVAMRARGVHVLKQSGVELERAMQLVGWDGPTGPKGNERST